MWGGAKQRNLQQTISGELQIYEIKTGIKIKFGGCSLKHVIAEHVADSWAANRLHHMLQDKMLSYIMPSVLPAGGFWPESKHMSVQNREAT